MDRPASRAPRARGNACAALAQRASRGRFSRGILAGPPRRFAGTGPAIRRSMSSARILSPLFAVLATGLAVACGSGDDPSGALRGGGKSTGGNGGFGEVAEPAGGEEGATCAATVA